MGLTFVNGVGVYDHRRTVGFQGESTVLLGVNLDNGGRVARHLAHCHEKKRAYAAYSAPGSSAWARMVLVASSWSGGRETGPSGIGGPEDAVYVAIARYWIRPLERQIINKKGRDSQTNPQ
jgi:hypothetical protein